MVRSFSFKKLFKYILVGTSALVLLFATGQNLNARPVLAAGLFDGGNFVTAVNNTQRNADWSDPVSANPGEIIEYRAVAQNVEQGVVAHDVTFHVDWPTSPSNSPQVRVTVSANGESVSDTATVNVNGTAGYLIIYENGHTRVFSPGCPNGCNADDSFRDGGNINVGDLAFGESAQVLFKAGITNPGPTPTPTPGPTATPTPAPTATPAPQSQTCQAGQVQVGVNAQGQIICQNISINNTNNNTNNNSQTQTVNVGSGNTAPAQVLGVSTLPKTGLPEIAWSALAFVPAGFKLRRFSKTKKALEDHPSFISELRQFKSQG